MLGIIQFYQYENGHVKRISYGFRVVTVCTLTEAMQFTQGENKMGTQALLRCCRETCRANKVRFWKKKRTKSISIMVDFGAATMASGVDGATKKCKQHKITLKQSFAATLFSEIVCAISSKQFHAASCTPYSQQYSMISHSIVRSKEGESGRTSIYIYFEIYAYKLHSPRRECIICNILFWFWLQFSPLRFSFPIKCALNVRARIW